jgi:hypothetical protein
MVDEQELGGLSSGTTANEGRSREEGRDSGLVVPRTEGSYETKKKRGPRGIGHSCLNEGLVLIYGWIDE